MNGVTFGWVPPTPVLAFHPANIGFLASQRHKTQSHMFDRNIGIPEGAKSLQQNILVYLLDIWIRLMTNLKYKIPLFVASGW